MIYDSSCGLPTKESFLSFASQFVSRDDSSRFVFLALNVQLLTSDTFMQETPGNYLLLSVIQKFIRKQPYILSAYRNSSYTLICFVDQSLLSTFSLVDSLKKGEQDFLRAVENDYPQHIIKLKIGLSEHVSGISIQDTIKHSLQALHTLQTSKDSELCKKYQNNIPKYDSFEDDIISLYHTGHLPHHILLYLQPRFSHGEASPYSAEVLTRIMDSNGRILTPNRFLTILDRNRLDSFLDFAVMERVLLLIDRWMQLGISPIKIGIHITTQSVLSPMFIDICSQILDKYSHAATYLQIELEEKIFEKADHLSTALSLFKNYNCDILLEITTLDSTSFFLPYMDMIDSIIINRANILYAMHHPQYRMSVNKLVELCKSCDISIICRNVETKEEAQSAKQNHVDLLQGFLFSRPVPLDIFQKKYLNYIFI